MQQLCEECDLPWDEVPPICKAAFSLSHGGGRQNSTKTTPAPSQKSCQYPADGTVAHSSHSSGVANKAGPIMILRDTVLGLVGQMEKLNSRLQKIETQETVFPSDPTNNDKSTQTESDCTSYPPASDEALALWTSYKISQKTDTELLIDAQK